MSTSELLPAWPGVGLALAAGGEKEEGRGAQLHARNSPEAGAISGATALLHTYWPLTSRI